MTRSVFELADGPREFAVTGEIDASNADDFAKSVGALSDEPVILDLSGLRYLDSAGFAALDRLLAAGAVVVVVSPDSVVYKAAQLMALPFHPDVETARRALDGS
ncbi:hypothetical protein A5707_19350 [Mycobacterium kyorinense]|uniref:STAS domain-containing protein n=1 Tax=Mycobacterium kyorinense TaxID=487514 RepID=A0A1A2ZDA4_9MYCO|nr:STAS domain-containing protein [Mycobacterium kyorinense]OBI47442.1 hypothetical protein A5707_19350 [Mycobacterium kyorinense]